MSHEISTPKSRNPETPDLALEAPIFWQNREKNLVKSSLLRALNELKVHFPGFSTPKTPKTALIIFYLSI